MSDWREDGRKRSPKKARSKFERWVLENGGTGSIAQKIGVHQVSVSNWCSKRCIPATNNINKILKLSKGKLTLTDILKGCGA